MEAVIVPSVRGILSKLVAVQDQGQLNYNYVCEVNYVLSCYVSIAGKTMLSIIYARPAAQLCDI